MYVAAFVIGLALVIMFHEFGHYATAKAFGMKVERFFLGFGPTLWSFRRGETEYGIKAIPAGGFVRITGMSAFEDVAEADRGRTFHEQAAWKRAIVLAAGSVSHFVVAAVVIVLALAVVGRPVASNAIAQVVPGTPAQAAGLEVGDRIVAVDGRRTADFEAVRAEITVRAGETVPLVVLRDGETETVRVELAPEDPSGRRVGFLGVAPAGESRRLGLVPALTATVSGDFSLPRLTADTATGLARVFSPAGLNRFFSSVGEEGPRDPEGPMSLVGVGQAVGALGAQGELFAILLLVAQLNIVLGVVNILPLPPMDGGHLAVLATEETVNAVRRRRGRDGHWRVDPQVLTPIALTVILFFVVVSLTALYVDLTKPASELLQ